MLELEVKLIHSDKRARSNTKKQNVAMDIMGAWLYLAANLKVKNLDKHLLKGLTRGVSKKLKIYFPFNYGDIKGLKKLIYKKILNYKMSIAEVLNQI